MKISYIEVLLSVPSLENSTNRGSDVLLVKKLQTYHTKLPALSPSDDIKNKNSDKNEVISYHCFYHFTDTIFLRLYHKDILSQYIIILIYSNTLAS